MPSHHSSSSHSSHSSSHSHHSSSHSSSRSHHSSSSHSSYSSHSGSRRKPNVPVYRERKNQPTGYPGTKSRIYRCKNHDYVHYDRAWTDESTGKEYKAGYYDEEGNFYEDIVFSEHGQILDTATAVCRCDYCRMEDSRPWAEREKPCEHCGGNMSLVSQIDELATDNNSFIGSNSGDFNLKSIILIILLVLISPCVIGGILGAILDLAGVDTSDDTGSSSYYEESSDDSSALSYNIPDIGSTMYLKADDGGYVLTDQSDYQDNSASGDYKKLVLDSDGNYYEKATDAYVWLNTDIDPPQFQYWYEGISSEYGDYGWMEYDPDNKTWYIEVSQGNWQPLDDAVYEKNADRMWHIDHDFVVKQ